MTEKGGLQGNTSGLADMCQVMSSEKHGDPIYRLALVFHATGGQCADPDYKTMIAELKKETWDSEFASDGSKLVFLNSDLDFGFK